VLLWLYKHAEALVFPSKYEGFGLPVLEAMSVGCPVICSKIASLSEVGGNAVLYADQTSAAYDASMRRLLSDNLMRKDMIELGLDRAGQFSWRNCAEQTISIYKQVLGGHK